MPLARVSVTAAILESSATAAEPAAVAGTAGFRCRSACAPASKPSASIDGIADAFPFTDEAAVLTRFVNPPDPVVAELSALPCVLVPVPSLPGSPASKLELSWPPKLVCSAPVFGFVPSRKFPSMDTASPNGYRAAVQAALGVL